jgi:SHS2 domain-containing protein
VRYALPQPYDDIGHTADVGIRVRGASVEEALARLVLAFSSLVTGGAAVSREREERLSVPGGPGLAGTAVALLRELLYRLATERAVATDVEIVSVDGRRDPERHAEGADVKAVTRHAARLEPDAGGWVAQAVLDI